MKRRIAFLLAFGMILGSVPAYAESNTADEAESTAGEEEDSSDAEEDAASDTENTAVSDMENAAASDMENAAASDMENTAVSDMENAAASDMENTAVSDMENAAASDMENAAASDEPAELIVFAAASMTETLTEIGELYKAVDPNVTLVFNFDSSGTLKTQIEEGADCDLFISAAPLQMNQLDASADAESGNTDGLDFVLSDTRIDLLENKVTLAVPEGNPADIQSYADLAAGLQDGSVLLAMGNADVPVGQYTQKILAYYDLNEEEIAAAGNITYGSNVKEVATQVSEAAVDCGIIYQTDAYSAGLTVVDTATEEMCGQVIYPAAVLNISKNQEAAQAFLDYLTGEEAGAVFESVGFTPIAGEEVAETDGEAEEESTDDEISESESDAEETPTDTEN